MVAKRKDTSKKTAAQQKQHDKETHAAATVFRVICLIGAIAILVLDALIKTFDYPVWVLGLLMGVVIGLGPEDLKAWLRGRGR